MLFCIAALGSTWGACALWFERLVGGSDRAEMGHGRQSRSTATQKHSMSLSKKTELRSASR